VLEREVLNSMNEGCLLAGVYLEEQILMDEEWASVLEREVLNSTNQRLQHSIAELNGKRFPLAVSLKF
jgi:hypothetical protein